MVRKSGKEKNIGRSKWISGYSEVEAVLVNMRVRGNKLYIGEAPVLVVDMQTQENYVHYEKEDIPFKKEVKLSPDLLQGKRPEVLNTALNYYYQTACEIAEETRIAREYGKRANRTVVVKEN